MKLLVMTLILFVTSWLLSSSAFGAGDAAKGKALFNDPKSFGGSRACSFCHPDGRGLEDAGARNQWTTPAGETKTLEDAINLCIVNANKGKALNVKSAQMADIVAYIKSLGKVKKQLP